MLDALLALPRKERRAIIKGLKTPTKKHLFDNIYTMTEELGLDKIDDYATRVKMRHNLIQKFPDTVFWDYPEVAYIASTKRKIKVPDFEWLRSCKVSTRGDLVTFSQDKIFSILVSRGKGGYVITHQTNISMPVHRLVASTYIPKPERLREIPHRELQVNHIDFARRNNHVSNLEWVTCKENNRHGCFTPDYHDEKFFHFEVFIDNGFKGRTFVLSEHDLPLISAYYAKMNKVVIDSRYNKKYRGFKVSSIKKKDIGDTFVGFPDDIAKLFYRNPCYFDGALDPVIGEVVFGKFRGHRFSLFGVADIERYFTYSGVYISAKNPDLTYYDCKFKRVTHREAIPLHGALTDEIGQYLAERGKAEKVYLFEVVVDNGFLGRKFILTENDVLSRFQSIAAKSIANDKDHTTYKGFKVTRHRYDEVSHCDHGFPDDIAELFYRDKFFFQCRVKPVIGTVTEGKYCGLEFGLLGLREASPYFDRNGVREVLQGKLKSYYGCTFRYATHEEVSPLHGKLTDEIGHYIRSQYDIGMRKYFLFEVVTDNGFLGRKFVLTRENTPDDFDFGSFEYMASANGPGHYKGFTVSRHCYEEIAEYELGFPKDIAELFYRNPLFFRSKIKPILATVLLGAYAGQQFSFLGARDSDNYFNCDNVNKVIKGKLVAYSNCVFCYCTHKEAIPFYGKMTQDIANEIRRGRFKWDKEKVNQQITLLNKDLQFPITLRP